MLRLTLLASLLAALLLAPATLARQAGQRVSFEQSFAAGDQMRYRFELMVDVAQTLGEDEGEAAGAEMASQRIQQEMVLALTIREVADNGALDLAIRVEEARISVVDGGGERLVQVPVAEDADDASPTTAIARAMEAMVLSCTVTPEGELRDLFGGGELRTAAGAMSPPDPRILGVFDQGQIATMLEPIFTADGADDAPRAIGDGWQTSDSVDLADIAALDITENWKLLAVSNATATIVGTPTYAVRLPSEPDPTRPTVALGETAANVVAQWHALDPRLLRRVATQSLEVRLTLGDLTVLQRQTSSMKLTRL